MAARERERDTYIYIYTYVYVYIYICTYAPIPLPTEDRTTLTHHQTARYQQQKPLHDASLSTGDHKALSRGLLVAAWRAIHSSNNNTYRHQHQFDNILMLVSTALRPGNLQPFCQRVQVPNI